MGTQAEAPKTQTLLRERPVMGSGQGLPAAASPARRGFGRPVPAAEWLEGRTSVLDFSEGGIQQKAHDCEIEAGLGGCEQVRRAEYRG